MRYALEAEFTLKMLTEADPVTVLPQVYCYPEGGVAIYKSALYYLAMACIPGGLGGVGAHNHNDLLSFELNVLGEDFIVDGGPYVYSAEPELRNAFLATGAHNTVAVRGREQKKMCASFLFALPDRSCAKFSAVSEQCFAGYHHGFGFRHQREIMDKGFYAPCYGRRVENKRLVVPLGLV